MTPFEAAERLDRLAFKVARIRGISRRNPHVFVEDKSEVVSEIAALAREMRTVPRVPGALVSTIRPGVRTIGRRDVRVETRRRAC